MLVCLLECPWIVLGHPFDWIGLLDRQCRVECPWIVQGDPHDYSTRDRQYVGCPWIVLGHPHDYVRGTDST